MSVGWKESWLRSYFTMTPVTMISPSLLVLSRNVPSCWRVLRRAEVTASTRRGSSVWFKKGLICTEREPAGTPLVGPSRYPAHPLKARPRQQLERRTAWRMSFRDVFINGVDPRLGVLRILRDGILADDVVVVNLGAFPAVVSFVIAGDVEAAPGLLGLEGLDDGLGLGHARVVRVKRDEIREGGNGLGGDALVVFGLFRLFVVGLADFEESVGADLVFAVTIGGALVGLGRFGVFGEQLVLVGRTDVHLGVGCDLAVGAILDDLVVHLDGLVHGREKRDAIPDLEPLALEEAGGDDVLAGDDVIEVSDFRIFLQEILVGLEGAFVLALGVVTASHDILRLRRVVVGEGPDLERALSSLEGEAVILFVERLLGHFQLILGA